MFLTPGAVVRVREAERPPRPPPGPEPPAWRPFGNLALWVLGTARSTEPSRIRDPGCVTAALGQPVPARHAVYLQRFATWFTFGSF